MTLTEKAIAQLRNYRAQRELSYILDCSPRTIIRYLDCNEKNGPLTTIGAINKIKELTGLTEKQILEAEQAIAR